jgi:predicted PhzF superfamily epimerase YddE/YHI9
MTLPAVLVEAFADRPCRGNGAAVVLLERGLADGQLQAVARSLNQSETAFLWRRSGEWGLRWFTPSCEVPLCGHGTLGALLALGHWGLANPGETLAFRSLSGALEATLLSDDGALAGSIVLPSPGLTAAPPPASLERMLAECLGTRMERCWTSPLGYTVALLPAEAGLATARLPAAAVPAANRPGLVLMQPLGSRGPVPEVLGERCRYQLRFLAPGLGIDEDPVTGSAHALVAPWWLEQLGVDRLAGWQCSPRSGGMVCEPTVSGMIRLTGTGHLLWDGHLHLDADAPSGASSGPGWDRLWA